MKTTTNCVCTVLMAAALLAPPILEGQVAYMQTQSEDFSRGLFTPELIMRHYREIGLSTEQRATITEAIRVLQSVVVDPQWRLMEVSQNLTELLESTPIDELQALLVIDQVFEAEAEIKRANISALIQIKNALTQEQRDRLTELRGNRFGIALMQSQLRGLLTTPETSASAHWMA